MLRALLPKPHILLFGPKFRAWKNLNPLPNHHFLSTSFRYPLKGYWFPLKPKSWILPFGYCFVCGFRCGGRWSSVGWWSESNVRFSSVVSIGCWWAVGVREWSAAGDDEGAVCRERWPWWCHRGDEGGYGFWGFCFSAQSFNCSLETAGLWALVSYFLVGFFGFLVSRVWRILALFCLYLHFDSIKPTHVLYILKIHHCI